MNSIMGIPGFKGVIFEKNGAVAGKSYSLCIVAEKRAYMSRLKKTIRVHDYRIQKIKQLKWFERLSTIFYKRRRYVCDVGRDFRRRVL